MTNKKNDSKQWQDADLETTTGKTEQVKPYSVWVKTDFFFYTGYKDQLLSSLFFRLTKERSTTP